MRWSSKAILKQEKVHVFSKKMLLSGQSQKKRWRFPKICDFKQKILHVSCKPYNAACWAQPPWTLTLCRSTTPRREENANDDARAWLFYGFLGAALVAAKANETNSRKKKKKKKTGLDSFKSSSTAAYFRLKNKKFKKKKNSDLKDCCGISKTQHNRISDEISFPSHPATF